MDMQRTEARAASNGPGDISNRAEKGSAMTLIRAETKATNDKTARLRAQRMAHEAEAAAIEAAAPPVKKATKTAKTTKAAKAPKRAKA